MIDPDRVDNSVTNDGFTMRDMRQAIGARDDYDGNEDTRESEGPEDHLRPVAAAQSPPIDAADIDPAAPEPTGSAIAGSEAALIGPRAPTGLDTIAIQLAQDSLTVQRLVGEIDRLETAIEEAADSSDSAAKKNALLLEKKRMRLARIKTNGAGLKSSSMRGTTRALSRRGPSQIVTYSSRFVNKIR